MCPLPLRVLPLPVPFPRLCQQRADIGTFDRKMLITREGDQRFHEGGLQQQTTHCQARDHHPPHGQHADLHPAQFLLGTLRCQLYGQFHLAG